MSLMDKVVAAVTPAGKTPSVDKAKLTERYRQEFERYIGDEAILDDSRQLAGARQARGESGHAAR
jgi:hypothetical protein